MKLTMFALGFIAGFGALDACEWIGSIVMRGVMQP